MGVQGLDPAREEPEMDNTAENTETAETPQGEPEATTPAPAPKPAPPATSTPDPDDGIDWKAEARKWEARAKDNGRKADSLSEDARAAQAEALRVTIAAKHGVGGDYLDLIPSGDAETIEAAAEKVAGLISRSKSEGPSVGAYVPPEGETPAAPLNSDRLEAAIKEKLGLS
jgi:hypothetical protein